MVRCKTNAGSPAKHLKNTNKHYFFRNQQTISMHSSSTVLKFNNSENFVYFCLIKNIHSNTALSNSIRKKLHIITLARFISNNDVKFIGIQWDSYMYL